jgi:hypothetical protein
MGEINFGQKAQRKRQTGKLRHKSEDIRLSLKETEYKNAE